MQLSAQEFADKQSMPYPLAVLLLNHLAQTGQVQKVKSRQHFQDNGKKMRGRPTGIFQIPENLQLVLQFS